MKQRSLYWFLLLVTCFGSLVVIHGAYELFQPLTGNQYIFLTEIALICVAMSSFSARMPSGATWRPGLSISMLGMFFLPPSVSAFVPVPFLIVITARTHAVWWKYVETIAHVGTGLFMGTIVYQFLADALMAQPLTIRLVAPFAALLVHLIVNRGISAVIVARRDQKPVGKQFLLTVRELHWGYAYTYLLILLVATVHRSELTVAMVLAAAVLVGVYRAVSHRGKVIQLQQSVWTDGLTHVPNRAAWESFVASQQGRTLEGTLAVIDVNDFKHINDQFGHAVGDEVLRDLAQTISDAIPKAARLFRFGGDEFVVYAPKDAAEGLYARIHVGLHEANHRWLARGIMTDVSVGIAHLPDDSMDLQELFLVADKRMYEEKKENRLAMTGMEIGIPPNLLGLILALETRDKYIAGHNYRVAYYAFKLAERMGLESRMLRSVFRAGIVHDVGKIGVPDAILSKPSRLSSDETVLVRTHVHTGYDICTKLGFAEEELEVILLHHERWDGTGYPRALHGDNIPLLARITAIADTYDALTSSRPHREAWSHNAAMAFLEMNAGILFDPLCVLHWVQLNGDIPVSQQYPQWVNEGLLLQRQ